MNCLVTVDTSMTEMSLVTVDTSMTEMSLVTRHINELKCL